MKSRWSPWRAALIVTLLTAPFAVADLPFPALPAGTDPYDWPAYLFIASGDCSAGNASTHTLPGNFDCENDWKFTDYRSPAAIDPQGINKNPQEFYGVRGVGTNKAWEISTGRPDVVIAVLDSGIRWEDHRPDLLRKYYLNRGELPLPQGAGGGCAGAGNPGDTRFGGYDWNGDGVFNVADYADDSRASDLNGNGDIDPEDLIRIFSDSIDGDGNGYVDDISGWDFFENDNNPQDDVDYGHGTGEAEDSTAEAGFGADGQCPMCMMMPMRVGDSFVADVNHFAEAVVYATDNGAAVVQEALGTLNHTSFGQAAVDYAYRSGVIVNASEADEAAGHHMWPAAYEHTMVVNSIRTSSIPAVPPQSYLFFNGCTNFGGYTYMAIPSTSCSSEATGRSSGVSGLLQSAARNAVERGSMTNYLRDDGSPAPFPLSGEELKQLWRLSADDIDFSSSCPGHDFCDDAPPDVLAPVAPADNYAPVPQPASTRYQSVKGWDYFFGYGRSNAARLLRFIGVEDHATVPDREYLAPGPYGIGADALLAAQDRIPPEADLQYPRFWQQYGYRLDVLGGTTLVLPDEPASPGEIVIHGRAAANRVTSTGGTFDYVVEYAPHVQGQKSPLAFAQASSTCGSVSGERSGGPWTEVVCVTGNTSAVEGELARIDVDDLVLALASNPNPFDPATDPTSEFQPEQYAVRLRLRVIAHPANASDLVNNEAVHQKQIDVYPASEAVMRDDLGVPHPPGGATAVPGIALSDLHNADSLGRTSGGEGSPSFHDLDGDGVDELILPSTDGVVHAYSDVATGAELLGWPVTVDPLDGVADRLSGDGATPVDNAYTRGDVVSDVYGAVLLGSAAVADLDDDGTLEVMVADLEGKLYVWEHDGTRRPGFPVSVDRAAFSKQRNCTAATIPACDDYDPGPPKRHRLSSRDWGFNSAPAIGDLDADATGLEIVIGANDSHVYAWRHDGTPVPGWPVVLRDPAKVAAMDPVSHFWTYAPGANAHMGAKILVSPALGDLDGDGDLEVVIPVNEQYEEPINSDIVIDPALGGLGESGLLTPGNVRIYALHHTGTLTQETPATAVTPHLHDHAYVPGWPVPLAFISLDLLPYVGEGVDGSPVLADIDGDGRLEVATASAAGPGYLLNHDGSSFLGNGPSGNYRTLETETFGPASTVTDKPSYIGVGAMAFGSLDGGAHLSVAGPGAGLLRLLDIVLEADQLGAQDNMSIWDATTGLFEPNAPILTNDLQFFTPPIVADLTGDGLAETVTSTAVGDTVAAGLAHTSATALRHFTGGWIVASAAVGDAPLGAVDDDLVQLANVTREGTLRLTPTPIAAGSAAACTAQAEWPEYGHDAHNSHNYETDAERPGPIRDLVASAAGDGAVTLAFTATGDDRACGNAASYRVQALPGNIASPVWSVDEAQPAGGTPAAAGQPDSVTVGPLDPGTWTVLLRAVDEQGNGSAVASAVVSVP